MDESHDAYIIVQTTDATSIDTEFEIMAAMYDLDAEFEALVASSTVLV